MEIVEVRRLANVSRLRFPLVNVAARARNFVPKLVLFREVAVKPAVSLRIKRLAHQCLDLFHRGPDVAKINPTPAVPASPRRCPSWGRPTAWSSKGYNIRRTNHNR